MSPDSGGNVGGGDKSCLTTYIFNPVETCTGTPSPEKFIRTSPGEYFLFNLDCSFCFKVDKNVFTFILFLNKLAECLNWHCYRKHTFSKEFSSIFSSSNKDY